MSTTRPQIDPSFLHAHVEYRLEIACAEAAMEKGSIHDVIVADIVRHAKCARNTFYETFASKEDCARATLGRAFDDALLATKTIGVEGLLHFVAMNPALARLALFDGIMLPDMQEVHAYGLRRFEALLREHYPVAASPEVYGMVVGGVEAILKKQFREHLSGMTGIEAELTEFITAPFTDAALDHRDYKGTSPPA